MKKKIKNKRMVLFFVLSFVLTLISSCNRKNNDSINISESAEMDNEEAVIVPEPKASPFAYVQSGKYPLWFQFTENGPVNIETLEDSFYTCAFIPWPYAVHMRFYEVYNNELYMAVNRDGFIKIAPNDNASGDASGGLALYRFPCAYFEQYTISGFVFYNDSPAGLLYLDDRFLDNGAPFPNPRTWTFDMKSNAVYPLTIPALELFPSEWNIDTLRLSSDGYYYYRVINQNSSQPQIRMLRTVNLAQGGNDVSLAEFQNSAPEEDVSYKNYELPVLPENFIYSGAVQLGDNIIAFWEEQVDYNIAAAGFLIVKN